MERKIKRGKEEMRKYTLLHALGGSGWVLEGGGRTTNKSGIILTKRQSYLLYPYPTAAALPVYFPLVTQTPKQEQRPRE